MNTPFHLGGAERLQLPLDLLHGLLKSGTKHVKDLRPVIWGLFSTKEIPGKTPLKLTTKITPDDNCRICRIKS